MKQICLCIEKLLVKYNQATVSGLGVFSMEQKSAKLLNNKLIAPSQQINFRLDKAAQNTLLAEEVCHIESCTFEQANEKIAAFVEQIFTSLEQNHECVLPHIGKLIEFATSITLINGTHRFTALPDVHLQAISTAQPVGNKEHITITFSRSVARYAAAIACIICLSIGLNFQHEQNIQQASFVKAKYQAMAEIPMLVIEQPTEDEEVEVIEQVADMKYHIIVASLATEEQAQSYLAQHQGYKLIKCGEKYRISAKDCQTMEEASDALPLIKEIHAAAWICKG